MAEEKKKNTKAKATGKTQAKRTTNRKGQSSRRRTNTGNRNGKNYSQNKKTSAVKKPQTKVTPKEEKSVTEVKKEVEEKALLEEVSPKEVEKEVVDSAAEKHEALEKTIIFDGVQDKNLDDVVDKLEEDNVVLEDKVIKRSKTKRAVIVLLIIAIVVILIAATCYVVNNENINSSTQNLKENIYQKVNKVIKNDGELTSKQEPESLEEDYEHIETISLADLEKKIVDKEDMVVLIASTNCYYSAAYEPIVDEVFAENDKVAYRINVTTLSDDEAQRLASYYHVQHTPTIFSIKDGYITAELSRTTTKEDLDKWLKAL